MTPDGYLDRLCDMYTSHALHTVRPAAPRNDDLCILYGIVISIRPRNHQGLASTDYNIIIYWVTPTELSMRTTSESQWDISKGWSPCNV